MPQENGSMQVAHQKTPAFNCIKPITHKALFIHCALGVDLVSPGRFERDIKPLLLAHGVKEIRIVKQ